MDNLVGVKALKEFNLAGKGMFFEGKVYFVTPALADVLLKRNLVSEFIPKSKEKVEKQTYSKPKKGGKI